MKRLAALLIALPLALNACSGDDKKQVKEPVGGGGGGGGGGNEKSEKKDEAAYVSANRVTVTNSLSNNPLTSQTISKGKAEQQAQALGGGKDKKTIEGKISAERLAGRGAGEVMAAAKRLADLEMEKNPNKEIDAAVKLDIALAAINSKQFALAEHFLDDITDDKKAPAKVRAGAYNAFGVMALRDDRVPEAVLYFRQALKEVGNYKPALLNLGFTALKGGDLAQAKRNLGEMQSDWFVKYGLISVERMEGDTGRANTLCDDVLKKEANHKAALFNCGLLEYQNKKQYKKAIELVGKAAKARGGEAGWDERIQMMETRIDQEAAKDKAEAGKKAAAAADKNKKPAAPPAKK